MASKWNCTSNVWFQSLHHGTLRYDLSDLAFWDVGEGFEDTLNQNLGWGFRWRWNLECSFTLGLPHRYSTIGSFPTEFADFLGFSKKSIWEASPPLPPQENQRCQFLTCCKIQGLFLGQLCSAFAPRCWLGQVCALGLGHREVRRPWPGLLLSWGSLFPCYVTIMSLFGVEGTACRPGWGVWSWSPSPHALTCSQQALCIHWFPSKSFKEQT